MKRSTNCEICAKARATTTCYREGTRGRRTYHVCEKCNQPALVIVETFDLEALPESAALRQLDCPVCLAALAREKFAVRVNNRIQRSTYYAHQGCARQQGAVNP